MARPVYPYELSDPDFSWLLATFQESNPDFKIVDVGCLPLVLVNFKGNRVVSSDATMTDVDDGMSENDDEVLETND